MIPAIRIAEDRQISVSLIYDGKLRESRTEVAYLSPKRWGGGSIYGSFCFDVSWAAISEHRKLYWVEANRAFRNPIARFLLSWHDVGRLDVTPYDPTKDNGPLRAVGDKWYWLDSSVPEIVIDDPIPASDLVRLIFDDHRQGYCNYTKNSSCPEMDAGKCLEAQASFIARLLGGGALGLEELMVDGTGFAWGVYGAFQTLWRRLFSKRMWGGPVTADEIALDIIVGACLAYNAGERERAQRLMDLIDTEERAERMFCDLIRARFEFPTFKWDD